MTTAVQDVRSVPVTGDEGSNVRGIRIEKRLWEALEPLANVHGLDRSALIRQFVRWYVREPGVQLPPRPGADTD